MYHTITKEHSLFFINEQYVDEFKAIAEKLNHIVTLTESNFLSIGDKWISAFNFWTLLQPNDNIIEFFDKTLYYSANYIIISKLKNDYQFNYIKTHPDTTPELIYFFTILLTNEIYQWFYELIDDNNLQDIYKINSDKCYFQAHLGDEESVNSFINLQARIVKVLVNKFSYTNELERIVKNCSNQAYIIFEDSYSK